MGSSSSKEQDPNQSELGRNPQHSHSYALRNHPHYSVQHANSQTTIPVHEKVPIRTNSEPDGKMYHQSLNSNVGDNGQDIVMDNPLFSDAMDVDSSVASTTTTSIAAACSNNSVSVIATQSQQTSVGPDGLPMNSHTVNPAPNRLKRKPTMEAEVVPMVFRWEHGGRNVSIMGTFNGWREKLPMHRSGNDFTYIANLTKGKHAYKFYVDNEWRVAPDQLSIDDIDGGKINFVDVSEFTPLSDFTRDDKVKEREQDDQHYGRFIPDIDEYTKDPPPLPPHLRHIILNKVPPSVDRRLLPVPQHVALNHLYCTAIKDRMMVLGVTQRYKQKFVTTVYYSLMPQ